MKVTVIIPNYNGISFLKDCLKALEKQTYKDFQVTVVDNGSTDESVAYVRKHHPQMQVISFHENLGFAKAMNAGVHNADTPYVLALNNDTIPDPSFIQQLVKLMESDSDIFSCAACILKASHPDLIDTAGDLYTLPGYAVCRGQGLKASGYRKNRQVLSGCGAAVLYRRDLYETLGGMDEHFFAYLEDVDLGYRARLSGYKNLYCAGAKVLHIGSATSGQGYTSFKVFHSARNNICLIHKNMPPAQKALNLPFILAGCILKYFYFKKIDLGSDYLKGILEGLKIASRLPSTQWNGAMKKQAFHIQGELFVNTIDYIITLLKRSHV